MTAAKSAEDAASAARQLCHDLYQPHDIGYIYRITAAIAEAGRSLEQAASMLARHVEGLDPDGHYDDADRDDERLIVARLADAAELLRNGETALALNALSHIGVRS